MKSAAWITIICVAAATPLVACSDDTATGQDAGGAVKTEGGVDLSRDRSAPGHDTGSADSLAADQDLTSDGGSPGSGWALGVGGLFPNDLAADSAGNVFVVGTFYDTITLGSVTLTSAGKRDVCVAKLDSAGKVLWAKAMGGSADDLVLAAAADSAGDVVLTGFHKGSGSFGGLSLPGTANRFSTFVTKIDGKTGKGTWAVETHSPLANASLGFRDVAVDSAGQVYLVGESQGVSTLGTVTVTSSTKTLDIAVVKLDAKGVCLWARSVLGPSSTNYSSRAEAVALDGAGNIYTTGYFEKTRAFGSTTLTCTKGRDAFLAKMDSKGAWVWAKALTGPSMEEINALVADSAGNTYLTGAFAKTLTVGSTTLTSTGVYDVVVAKADSSGAWRWAMSGGGWSSGSDMGQDIALDAAGHVVVTGAFDRTLSFGTVNLTATAGQDIMLLKLSAAGKALWGAAAGGQGRTEKGYAVGADSAGHLFVTGAYKERVTLGGTPLAAVNKLSTFVWRPY